MAESKAAAHSPALDGVRALAASMVVLHHIGTLAGTSEVWATGAYFRRMDSGVSIFFVLSGFLLYRPMLARQLAGAPVVSFGSFWRSRFWRIFPAYWLALAVLWAIEAVKIVDAENTFHLVTLTQIYNPYWILTGIVPAWSLATEISFYALLPFLALGIARLGRGTTIGRQAGLAVVVALLLYAASFAWRIVLETCFPLLAQRSSTWLPGQIDVFALGMLLAAIAAWGEHDAAVARFASGCGRFSGAWVLGGVFLFWFVSMQLGLTNKPFERQEFWRESTRQALYGFVGLCLVVPFALAPGAGSRVHRAFGWRPIAWLGLISYGVYLWHQMFLVGWWSVTNMPYRFEDKQFGLRLAWTVPLSILIAAASFYLFEKPLHDRFGKRRDNPAAGRIPPARGDGRRRPASLARRPTLPGAA
jgi:peptidoglycan/LPS O-acetylase OafA/YrhL